MIYINVWFDQLQRYNTIINGLNINQQKLLIKLLKKKYKCTSTIHKDGTLRISDDKSKLAIDILLRFGIDRDKIEYNKI